MSDLKLQPDELELLASYENDEWQSAKNVKEQKEQYRVYARATFRKRNTDESRGLPKPACACRTLLSADNIEK